jgi:bacterioferritin-associated ferredoxin
MIVCHCKGISDRAIRAAVRGSGESLQQPKKTCEPGVYCGGCQPLIREIVDREAPGQAAPGLLASVLAMLGLPVAG